MLEKKFTKNAEKTYFFVFAKCILKRNLPRIFISKPVLRFRLNDEVQLTEVQKNLGWKYFLVWNLFFCIFFRNWFPGLLKNPPRHPYLWAFVNNNLLPSTIRSWYTHVFKARKYTDSLFTEQHIGLVYFFVDGRNENYRTHFILNVKSTGRFLWSSWKTPSVIRYVNVRFWHSGSIFYTKIWCI